MKKGVFLMKNRTNKFIKRLLAIMVGGCLFGVAAGLIFQGYMSNASKNNQKSDTGTNLENLDTDSLEDGAGEAKVSHIVENIMPAIVAINTSTSTTVQDFFGRQYNEKSSGSGSGIIIGQNNNEILIVTNNHVINNANAIGILFIDDTTATATVKGTAPNSDLAVLAVDMNEISDTTIDAIRIATLGSSDTLELGDMAIAIGNALGYGQSVTGGYISALDREITVENVTLTVLQTDAAINPGNSGGALLNSKGEVIGINSVKYIGDNVESVGYAIPISDAIPIINNLMNRTVLTDSEKAYLGIEGKDVTDIYSQRFNLPVGVYVLEIKDKSAAREAGVKAGDIIVAINDVSIATRVQLQDALDHISAGSTGTITVKTLNNGEYEEQVLEITFDKRP